MAEAGSDHISFVSSILLLLGLRSLPLLGPGNVKPNVDSALFKSMKLAAAFTGMAFVLVTARTYIGDNIDCTAGAAVKEEETKAITSYCFITSTFTLSNFTLPAASPHPGLGPVPHREVFPPGIGVDSVVEEDEGVTFHAYYQWVPFMIALQSVLLFLPTKIWQSKEDGHLEYLLCDTHKVHVNKELAHAKRSQSVNVFNHSRNFSNGKYLAWFIMCEILGCGFTIGNLFLTDAFLGGQFFDFGKGALSYLTGSVTDPNNPLNIVFPKIGKCTWYKYGPSGSIVSMDAICVLPLNIVNEKTYVVLWLTYILLCAFTPGRLDALITRRSENKRDMKVVLKECSKGDKFILWCLQSYVVDFGKWTAQLIEEAGFGKPEFELKN
ncbi:hypothetical protein HAZT_HAZT009731 [Hyalella azteca]|uniref:Innexin n=1 Tax=Hyalella azteca TaxID=294128 RepID=A0A6A0GP53_HYAAZ|nr:hypothetical protein HAZT_HAZT009731 [Hyalella azteca]